MTDDWIPFEADDLIPLSDETDPAELPPDVDADPAVQTVVFEDLTLAEALGYLVWRPVETARLFWQVLIRDPGAGRAAPDATGRRDSAPGVEVAPDTFGGSPGADAGGFVTFGPVDVLRDGDPVEFRQFPEDGFRRSAVVMRMPVRTGFPKGTAAAWLEFSEEVGSLAWTRLGMLLGALVLALQGGAVLHDAATTPSLHSRMDTNDAGVWFVLMGAVFVSFELFVSRHWWADRLPRLARWLRARHAANDLGMVWRGVLAILAGGTLFLATRGVGGEWGALVWLLLAAVFWIGSVIGHSTPKSAAAPKNMADDDMAPEDADDDPVIRVRSVAAQGPAASDSSVTMAQIVLGDRPLVTWFRAHFYRLLLVPVAMVLSAEAYLLNVSRNARHEVVDVVFTSGGFAAWVGGILLWIVILSLDVTPANVRRGLAWLRRLAMTEVQWGWVRRVRIPWPWLAIAGITVLGAWFRLSDLSSTPPEMTSDHIEKLLDALRVSEGYRGVFFPNNGGREGFQMYVVALLAGPLGIGFSFEALKLATVIEGVITLPLLWWMAREVIGTATQANRQLGNWVGLGLAGLVAVSSWHVMLSRLGLRIVLTPLTTALVIGFLARVIRQNRVRDFVALGVVLGAGTYFYQANRMLPILVVIGVGLAMLRQLRTRRDIMPWLAELIGLAALALAPLLVYWYVGELLQQSGYTNSRDLGERLDSLLPLCVLVWFSILSLMLCSRPRDSLVRYVGGLLATIVVALAIYLPLHHYSEINSDDFWNRTRGRLFGEKAFWETDPDTGETIIVDPTLGDQVARFWEQRDVFGQNFRDALRMYHWTGDSAWINNAHGYPAMDGIAGGLTIFGAVMWGVWAVRRRDGVAWLVPLTIMVMLLPSALTLAYQIENPSFTRASGTIPAIFFLAALPLGTLCWRLAQIPWQARRVPLGLLVALVLLGGVLWSSIGPNWDNFFTEYRLQYAYSWKPYRKIAEPLREFAQGPGSYGNAFMVAYPHWLDHRILGTMAGDIRWPNGLVEREHLEQKVQQNAGTPYEYDPTKPLFVMYNAADQETEGFLMTTFPGGTVENFRYFYETEPGVYSEGNFLIYHVHAGVIG